MRWASQVSPPPRPWWPRQATKLEECNGTFNKACGAGRGGRRYRTDTRTDTRERRERRFRVYQYKRVTRLSPWPPCINDPRAGTGPCDPSEFFPSTPYVRENHAYVRSALTRLRAPWGRILRTHNGNDSECGGPRKQELHSIRTNGRGQAAAEAVAIAATKHRGVPRVHDGVWGGARRRVDGYGYGYEDGYEREKRERRFRVRNKEAPDFRPGPCNDPRASAQGLGVIHRNVSPLPLRSDTTSRTCAAPLTPPVRRGDGYEDAP